MGPPPPPEKWSADEIEAGRAECKPLAGLHVQFEALGPIRDGICGTPAPIRLKGFEQGDGPALAVEPAPVVSCRLAEALRAGSPVWFSRRRRSTCTPASLA